MDQPSKMKAGLVWGALLGVLSGLTWFSVTMGAQVKGVVDLLGWVILIGALLGAQLGYRAKASSVSYGGAYLVAFFVALFGGLIGAVAAFVVLSFVPGVLDGVRETMEQAMATAGAGGDPAATQMVMGAMTSPVALACMQGIGTFIGGLIVGLITSIFGMKKAATA